MVLLGGNIRNVMDIFRIRFSRSSKPALALARCNTEVLYIEQHTKR